MEKRDTTEKTERIWQYSSLSFLSSQSSPSLRIRRNYRKPLYYPHIPFPLPMEELQKKLMELLEAVNTGKDSL